MAAGSAAAGIKASIDGNPFDAVNFSHHPRTPGNELTPGKHALAIRMSPDTKNAANPMRAKQLVAN